MRPLRVFLCHASQDKPAVRELYNALKSEGWIDPWLDKAKILPGQDWEFVIEKAVDDSDVVIVCLSGQSVTKEGFVQREIRYAYDIALEKPEETIFLIPLRLDDCNVPRKLRTLHWVDYFGFDKKNSYADLLEALKLRYEQKMRLEGRLEAKEKGNCDRKNKWTGKKEPCVEKAF
ncbi:toll/interleukin-1 receptor domain-containing protein [Candidatus Villigracilis affinis]|uniref:toll/interleukin-1 receptor domain-containing protein n=1 Tax=Candidatus Villigracilis affinis TaxID=3140682 RepID=UPI001DC6A21A|nr:toll/interleukin-1 receptor domain-containing protein [Anaerolineales bacterium]